MAAKKRRRAKRAKTKKKKRSASVTARATLSNPRRRKRRRGVRVRKAASNPRKRTAKRRRRARNPAAPRAVASNPRRRRKSGKRRHKRNPGIPPFAMAALAGLAGVGAYVLANAGSYALTQQVDPTMATAIRNRRIAGGVLGLAGVGLAVFAKMPLLGAGVAAGGLVTLFGTEASVEVSKLLQPAPQKVGAVEEIGAVEMGAVEQLGMGSIGAPQDALDALLSPAH